MTKREYNAYVQKISPPSAMWKNVTAAFVSGGLICCVGQAFVYLYQHFGLNKDDTAAAVSVSMVLLGALLTGLGFYDRLAKKAGAGTLVPITGFANSVVAPALEFKSDDRVIIGTSQKHHEIKVDVLV
ncbi:MAG: SpoVA/SpoVAEb family sporulation membrane protein [Candidatus Heteroscillospira sp.]